MTDPHHLERLDQGVDAWNAWRRDDPDARPDLAGADLARRNLRGIDLARANLRGATLDRATLVRACLDAADLRRTGLARATLREATLVHANLREATLHHAELRGARLDGADLSLASFRSASLQNARLRQATLRRSDFLGATLTGSDLSGARLAETGFADTSLKSAYGLASCRHLAPSTVDHRTLERSGGLPRPFLEGCGVPGALIDEYLRETGAETSTCFISYSAADETLARRLRGDLETRGIGCFLACDDMLAGDKILECVQREIAGRERMLLILSAASVASEWVEREVKHGLYEEQRRRATVLMPLTVDDAIEHTSEAWALTLRIDREIDDWHDWNEPSTYRVKLQRLITALTTDRDW